jgi:hypothetical protein
MKYQENGGSFTVRSFIICTHPQTLLGIKSRKMRWAGHVARMVEERKVYRVLVGKPEGMRPLGRPRRMGSTWVFDWLGDVNWIKSAQDMGWWRALVNMVMKLRVLAPHHRVGWFVKSGMLQVCHCDSLFEVFIPPFQAQHTKVSRVYDHFDVKVYLLYIYLTACLVANFKQRLWSN